MSYTVYGLINVVAAIIAWTTFMLIPQASTLPIPPSERSDMKDALDAVRRHIMPLALMSMVMAVTHVIAAAVCFYTDKPYETGGPAWLTWFGLGLVVVMAAILVVVRLDVRNVRDAVEQEHAVRVQAAKNRPVSRRPESNVSYMSDYRPPKDARSDN